MIGQSDIPTYTALGIIAVKIGMIIANYMNTSSDLCDSFISSMCIILCELYKIISGINKKQTYNPNFCQLIKKN